MLLCRLGRTALLTMPLCECDSCYRNTATRDRHSSKDPSEHKFDARPRHNTHSFQVQVSRKHAYNPLQPTTRRVDHPPARDPQPLGQTLQPRPTRQRPPRRGRRRSGGDPAVTRRHDNCRDPVAPLLLRGTYREGEEEADACGSGSADLHETRV